MKLPVVFLLLFVLTQQVLGQHTSFKVSEPYKFKVINGDKLFLSKEDGSKILMAKSDKKSVYLQVFDAQKMKEVKEVEYKDFPKGFKLEALMWFAENAYLLYSIHDKGKETKDLYVRGVDFEKGTLNDFKKQLLTIEALVPFFIAKSSFDKRKLLLFYNNKANDIRGNGMIEMIGAAKAKDNYGVYGIEVLDESFSKISGGEIKMPYPNGKMVLLDNNLDSDGNIYFSLSVLREDAPIGKDKKTIPSYRLETYKIPVGQSEAQLVAKLEPKNFLASLTSSEVRKNKLVYWATYSTENIAGANGFSLFELDEGNQTFEYKNYEVPAAILSQRSKGPSTYLPSLSLHQLEEQEDGSRIIMGELFESTLGSRFEPIGADPDPSLEVTYNIDDIIIAKVDAAGKLAWMKRLPKRQIGYNSLKWSSFRYIEKDGAHYLIYTDHINNLDLPLDKEPTFFASHKRGHLIVQKINDETGKVSKTAVFDTGKVEGYNCGPFVTNHLLDLENGKFAIEFHKKKKEDVMVVVELK